MNQETTIETSTDLTELKKVNILLKREIRKGSTREKHLLKELEESKATIKQLRAEKAQIQTGAEAQAKRAEADLKTFQQKLKKFKSRSEQARYRAKQAEKRSQEAEQRAKERFYDIAEEEFKRLARLRSEQTKKTLEQLEKDAFNRGYNQRAGEEINPELKQTARATFLSFIGL